MSALLKMNVSPRTALLVIALVLGASLVAGGREARLAPPPPAAGPPPSAAAPSVEAPPPLELDKLERPGLGEPIANLFAPRAVPAPRAPQPARPAFVAPAAPPPPAFRYFGKFVDGGRTAVFVARGDEHFLAAPGATLAGEYRVEDVSPLAITLVHLARGTRQSIPIPPQD